MVQHADENCRYDQEMADLWNVVNISDFEVKFGFDSKFGDMAWVYGILRIDNLLEFTSKGS